MTKKLTESLEMYLKTVLVLEREYNPVRISQIAKLRGVSAASVSEAIQTLQGKGLIRHRAYQGVELSAQGRRIARRVEGRYRVLHHFLAEILGVSALSAQRDACEIEHIASAETMDRVTAFLEYIQDCKMNVSDVMSQFRDYYASRGQSDMCRECEVDTENPSSVKVPRCKQSDRESV